MYVRRTCVVLRGLGSAAIGSQKDAAGRPGTAHSLAISMVVNLFDRLAIVIPLTRCEYFGKVFQSELDIMLILFFSNLKASSTYREKRPRHRNYLRRNPCNPIYLLSPSLQLTTTPNGRTSSMDTRYGRRAIAARTKQYSFSGSTAKDPIQRLLESMWSPAKRSDAPLGCFQACSTSGVTGARGRTLTRLAAYGVSGGG